MKRPNVIILTADDLGYGYLGYEGGLKTLAPHLDGLATDSFQFHEAHTVLAWCNPSRASLVTGLYPWNHGVTGLMSRMFGHILTLPKVLKHNGYFTGLRGKEYHHTPDLVYDWDMKRFWGDKRDAVSFVQDFLEQFKASGKENFFLLFNSHWPHRPWPSHTIFDPKEVVVPPYLNDTPGCRKDLAAYYMAIRGLDDEIGAVLSALHSTLDDSLLIFTSDHGAAVPFVKVSCYPFSTHVPFLIRWPGVIPNGQEQHTFINHTELFPTIMELLEIPYQKEQLDGESYHPIFSGLKLSRPTLYTSVIQVNAVPAPKIRQTRAIRTKDYSYIVNFWSDGKQYMREDGSLLKQGAYESLTKERRWFFHFRCPEELYDLRCDPYCLENLIANRTYRSVLDEMRQLMYEAKVRTRDTAEPPVPQGGWFL